MRLHPMVFNIFNAVGIASIVACVWLTIQTASIATEWKAVILMGVLWLAGASFYFYEPLAGMTNPPMEWGYPRTVEGFWHALTRGQYDKVNPTDIFHDFHHFLIELGMLVEGVADAFSWVYMFFALLPLLFYLQNAETRARLDCAGRRPVSFPRRPPDHHAQPHARPANRPTW